MSWIQMQYFVSLSSSFVVDLCESDTLMLCQVHLPVFQHFSDKPDLNVVYQFNLAN